MLKHSLTLLLGAILITSIAAFPTTNAQLSLEQQQVESDGGGFTATLFQNMDDSFRVQVPEGWVIQDVNNTGSILLGEVTQGYGILAQLCPQEEEQLLRQAPPNFGSGSGGLYGSCEGAQENIIYILRYPALDTELQSAFGVSANSITTDDILLYHVQKLQQVGYSGIQIVNSTETSVNIIDAQTNQTTSIVPAKTVEMTYSTASAPNEIREGYFILTATNATAPNPGMTKGYSIFYEGNSVAADAQGQTTTATAPISLVPSPPAPPEVMQVFNSFELIAASEVIAQASAQQAAELGGIQGDTACDSSYPDVCIPAPPPDLDCGDNGVPENFRVLSPDPHDFDRDNDGIGCDSSGDLGDDAGDEDGSEEEDDNGNTSCDPSYPDVCILPPPPNLNCDDEGVPENFEVSDSDPHGFDGDNDSIGCESESSAPDDDDNGGEEETPPGEGEEGGSDEEEDGGEGEEETPPGEGDGGGEGNPNEFDDCVVPPGMDPGDVGC